MNTKLAWYFQNAKDRKHPDIFIDITVPFFWFPKWSGLLSVLNLPSSAMLSVAYIQNHQPICSSEIETATCTTHTVSIPLSMKPGAELPVSDRERRLYAEKQALTIPYIISNSQSTRHQSQSITHLDRNARLHDKEVIISLWDAI